MDKITKVIISSIVFVAVDIGTAYSEPVVSSKRLLLAQCGFPSRCYGFPGPGRIIVAPNAADAQSCHSAIRKCNNNVEIQTTFSSNPSLQDCSMTVTNCNLSF